jgi:uncharacterized phiE125 gp8 family phage protein
MSVRLITPPADMPVTLTEVKAHCRVDASEDDDLLETYIAVAVGHVEKVIGRSIMEQTWELLLDDFADTILLPKGPVQSITSVSYYDTNNVLQTVAAADYSLDNVSDPQWLVKAEDYTWPQVAEGVNNVIIRFVAGFETVPPEIKGAIFFLVNGFYDSRGGAAPSSLVDALLVNYRSYSA